MNAATMAMIERLSPNHNGRSAPIRCIVVHADASPNEEATLSWTSAAKSRVSYHVLVGRDGTCYRLVSDERRAWANGFAAWKGIRDVNSVALSVAFANRQNGKEALTPAQVAAAKQVIADWRTAWKIEDITTHKICCRYKNGHYLLDPQNPESMRKHDPEAAPNFSLPEFQ